MRDTLCRETETAAPESRQIDHKTFESAWPCGCKIVSKCAHGEGPPGRHEVGCGIEGCTGHVAANAFEASEYPCWLSEKFGLAPDTVQLLGNWGMAKLWAVRPDDFERIQERLRDRRRPRL